MVNRCLAAGCSNTPSDCVSLLKLPSNGVFKTHMGKASTADSSSVESYRALSFLLICSDHFIEDLFRGLGGMGCHGGLGRREGRLYS